MLRWSLFALCVVCGIVFGTSLGSLVLWVDGGGGPALRLQAMGMEDDKIRVTLLVTVVLSGVGAVLSFLGWRRTDKWPSKTLTRRVNELEVDAARQRAASR